MTQLPRVLSLIRRESEIEMELEIPRELSQFEGHFPEVPLLAGVVQIDWAINYAREHFSLPPVFKRVTALKFMRVIRPLDRPRLLLRADAALGEFHFRYSDARGAFSSGCVGFADV